MDESGWSRRQKESGYHTPKKVVFVAANLTGKPVEFKATLGETPVVPANGSKSEILMAEHGSLAADGTCSLGSWGYVVIDL